MTAEVKNEPAKENKFKKFIATKGVLIVLILIAVIGVGVGGYYFFQYQKTQAQLANPATEGKMEVEALVEKVGRLVELPRDEVPTVATVSDINKLKNQAFFARAHNGDKVLIYQKAKKAVLYSPSLNKVIEFGPINVGTSTQVPTASPSGQIAPTPKIIKVTLRNGTKTVGFAATIEKDLAAKAPNILVVSKDNAAKQDYTKTLVVDLSGTLKDQAKSLAGVLGGAVGSLPTGEVRPTNSEILVILGK